AKNPQTNLTHDGVLIGTPNYMSPEQIMGKALDGRSDLFSLAAVLYEMLTGERPFSGDSVTTIIYRILHEQPKEPRALNAQVPPAISEVLMRALAKDPARRFQTGGDLAQALQGFSISAATAGKPGEERARPPAGGSAMLAGGASDKARSVREGTAARWRMHREVTSTRGEALRARIRVALILVGAATAVLLLPGSTTIDDRWGRGGAGGEPPFYRTAGIVSSPGGLPAQGSPASRAAAVAPAVALPGDADSVTVTWRTSPPGGRIYLDDVEIPSGVARIPRNDAASHAVVAENDCFIEKVSWKMGRADAGGKDEAHTIELKTRKVAATAISSTPTGARILLDGRETGLTAPAQLPLSVCGTHTLTGRLEGYRDEVRKIEGHVPTLSLQLSRIPEGLLKISSPYPVEILEKGKRLGRGGESLKLTAGKHTLIIRNEELFVEKTLEVEVQPERTISPDAGLPGMGTLTVLASPSNCNIFINDREIGAPPINDRQLAAGTYVIRAVYLPTGEAKEVTVTIATGRGERVPFRFNQ
ncbi:MAG TPA: serine/threonine-protein kinase, partial [Candidatus Polarisedimenticolia bacterium]